MSAPLLLLKDTKLRFGNTQLLEDAELSVSEGERLCLVGRNGSGKSTLLKIAAGLMEPDGGTRFLQPGIVIRYLPQMPDLSGYATTRDFVEAGLGEGHDSDRTFYLLGKLGLSGDEEPERLSGGEARRAALARTLAPMPDILLLDEPTNHLDLPAIEWLEAELSAMKAAMVLISHDRRFLQDLSRASVWLDRGRTLRLARGFEYFESWRDDVLAQEELDHHKLDRKIAAEEDWVRYGVSGRRKRNQGRLARLGELRQGRREQLGVTGQVKLEAAEAEGGATRVIEAKNLSKNFNEKHVVRDFSMRVLRGNRVGIVGANGAGKTTLLNMLIGRLKPDAGNAKIASNVKLAVLDQNRSALDPETIVSAVLTDGSGDMVNVGGKSRHVVSYMKDFLFAPAQARAPVRVLSGGERARLLLAKILAAPSNLLVLDEPTNDLDLETLDLLEEMLSQYPGTILVVSHDRDFLDRVVSSVLMAEGDGKFVEYAGGYSDMLAQRGHGVALPEPKRTKANKNSARKAHVQTDTPPRNKPPRNKASGNKALGKMSFKDKHALETLPTRIAELEEEIAELNAQLADSNFYARDPDGFAKASAKLEQTQKSLSEAEERWLELETLREELGQH